MFEGLLLFAMIFCLLGVIQHDAKQPSVRLMLMTWIKPDPKQARKDFGSEEELRRFGEELKRKQLQPLVCLADGRLICGERRYRAMLLVGMTHAEVKVLEEELSDTQIRVYQLCENLSRKDLNAFERWLGCVDLLSFNTAWGLKDLAAALHADPSSVTRWMSPSRCIPAWQDALKEGKVGISDCYAASQLPEKDQAELLATKLGGASRDQLAQLSRDKRRNGQTESKPAVTVQRLRCPLPSGLTVQFSGKAVSLQAACDAMKDLTAELKAAMSQGLDARTVVRVLADKSKSAAK